MARKPKARHVVQPDDYEGWSALVYHLEDGTRIDARYKPDVDFIEYPVEGSGRFLPERFEVLIDEPEHPYEVRLDFELLDGRPSCQVLCVRSRYTGPVVEITSEKLRKVRVRELISLAIRSVIHPSDEPVEGQRRKRRLPTLDDFAEMLEAPGAAPLPSNAQLPDEHYEKVAHLYRTALGAKEHPTRFVAEQLYKSRSTAARYVMEARERGFLGETEKGRAGEAMAAPKATRMTRRKK
ncbi:MAG: hypothetical protein ACRDJV_04805 [Actinomycetota bacterium]